jgi:hypothetical protein
MARPNFTPGNPENDIKPTTATEENVDMNAVLGDILSEAEEENQSATPTPAPEVTSTPAPTGDGKPSEPKKTYKYTAATTAGLGLISSHKTEHESVIKDTAAGKARAEFKNKVKIVGYLCKADEKIDFKRNTVRKDGSSAAFISYELKMYAPSKPDRIVVKYPIDLFSKITSYGENLTTSDYKGLNTTESAYALKILSVASSKNELYDWVAKNTVTPYYIQEDEKLFIPYTHLKKSTVSGVDTYVPTVYNSWTVTSSGSSNPYLATGGHPGITISVKLNSKKESHSINALTGETTVDLLSSASRDLKVTYKNTCRPRWIGVTADGQKNYICDKSFETIAPAVPETEDERIRLSKAYFRRYFDDNVTEYYRSKKAKEENIVYTPAEGSTIEIQHTSEDSFTATPFTDVNYWKNASVDHWYLVDTTTPNAHKLKVTGDKIRLIKREAKASSLNTATSATKSERLKYANVIRPLTKDEWETTMPVKIKDAIGKELLGDFTYETYTASLANTATISKPKSKISLAVDITNMTFAEIAALVDRDLSTGGTDNFQ